MEPPAKKARTEDAEPGESVEVVTQPVGSISIEPVLEPEELEFDDTTTGPKVKDKATFYVEDTTMNVLNSDYNVMMPLTDGGLQYLLAGARANLGVKTGRYMFEIRVLESQRRSLGGSTVTGPLEDANVWARVPQPRSQLRIGFASVKSSLFLGHSEHAIGFDSEGFFLHGKARSQVSQKFSTGDVVAVVLNLNSASPNAHTISLFKNGKRASEPQPLPELLKDKALYPILTFKNVSLYYNFGPPLAPLPFKCRSINEVLQPDVSKKKEHTVHSEGEYEVLLPVSLPDEGGFDWLDQFLQKHPHYVELSDRALLNWCEKSGLTRPRGYGLGARGSNDKPEMGMGIMALDDGSVRRVLYESVAPIQQRNYVVMEVRGNLLKEERIEQLSHWTGFNFKRVGVVMLGEPPAAFKKYGQEVTLRVKQEVSDQEFRAKQVQEKQQLMLQKRQRQLDKEKRKAAKKAQKTQEAMLKRLKYEQAKKEAEAKGEVVPDPPDEEIEQEEEDDEEETEEPNEPMEQEPPTVELTDEEKKRWWSKQAVSDLTMYVVNTTFQKFSLPVKEEGFDELRYPWQNQDKVKEYLKAWVQDRKLTSRVEDLEPGDWFLARQKEWQKALAAWHAKQSSWKASETKKQMEATQREQKRKAFEAQVADCLKEGKDPPEKPEGLDESPKETPKVDVDLIDVFSVEDINDLGNGEPLFANFQFEDWSMLSLRFELHLLSHAFRKDANDADRVLVPLDHLPFYYNRYFKKALSTKTYGADTVEEVARLVRDTTLVTKNPISKLRVLESQLPEELECLNIFVMLTEEHRRERQRRLDLGDDTARLKFLTPGVSNVVPAVSVSGGSSPSTTTPVSAAVAAASTVVRPSAVPQPMASGGVSPTHLRGPVRPSFGVPGLRPNVPGGPVRMPGWRPGW